RAVQCRLPHRGAPDPTSWRVAPLGWGWAPQPGTAGEPARPAALAPAQAPIRSDKDTRRMKTRRAATKKCRAGMKIEPRGPKKYSARMKKRRAELKNEARG